MRATLPPLETSIAACEKKLEIFSFVFYKDGFSFIFCFHSKITIYLDSTETCSYSTHKKIVNNLSPELKSNDACQ
jgi:hypothetical protein